MTDQPQTNVVFKLATVRSIRSSKGVTRITIDAPSGEGTATLADLNELTEGSFLGTVTIKGHKQQQTFELPPLEKPGKDGAGGGTKE